MREFVVVMGLVAAAASCGGGDDHQETTDAATGTDGASCTPSGTTQIVYLNRNGGTFSMGTDDAVANTSIVLDMQRTLAAWPHDNWDAIKTCITDGLSPFNLDIVDVDPGTVDHHEIVFSTTYWDASSAAYVGSVSATGCGTPNKRSLSFLFGTVVGTDATAACETAISQFASASTGLDHSRDCHDYLGGAQTACGPKEFVDMPIECGEMTARSCTCTNQSTQNSNARMHEVHGTRCP